MAMPARYRERLLESCGGRLVVTVDRDHCLLVYPLPEWEIIEEKLNALPSLNKQSRLLQRLLIGHATELDMDGQGRILLPAMLRDFAGLKKKTVLIGQGKKFEIWDEETWNESQEEWVAAVQADDGELPAALEDLSLDEALESLNIRPSGIYIDATFGRGGHSRAILQQLDAKGRLIAFDQDLEAVAFAKQQFADEPRLSIEHCNFNQVADVIERYGLKEKIDGVLMDLGVSSPQLDDAERGFSFLRSGPLDMRMDTSQGETARQWLARVKPADLINVLKRYGEEKFAKRIATAIVETRAERDITETGDLAEIISNAIPVKEKHKHPATRSFQAIRIYINEELRAVEQGLQGAVSVLAKGGRLSVISFHSLEDRIVKRFMRDISSRPKLPAGLPVMEADIEVPYRLAGKPVVAGEQELKVNPRARSARLRVLERRL